MSQTQSRSKKKKKKGGFKRFLFYSFIVLFVVGVIVAGAGFSYVKRIIDDTPEIKEYNIDKLLDQNSYLYDKDGNLIQLIQDGRIRTVVDLDQIDQDVIDAFIAIEDKTFYKHNGFNYVRLIGSIIESLQTGRTPAGTSTITQQYARNMYLSATKTEKTYIRKIKEAYYTVQIENHLDKNQILAAYLNTIDLGSNISGVEAAAQRYFSKSANDVDYIEAAILAGIPKATSTYGPFINIANESVTSDMTVLGEHDDGMKIIFNSGMIDRFKTVIYAMHTNGFIDQAQADYAYEYADSKQIIERFHPGTFNNIKIQSYFEDMVKDEIVAKLMDKLKLTREEAINKMYGGGLHIYSTLDVRIQDILTKKYEGEPFNNVFNKDTANAVIQFQKKYDIDPIGIVGPATIEKMTNLGLLEDGALTQTSYQAGMTNDEVIIIKNALEAAGFLFRINKNLPSAEAYRDANKNILQLIENSNKTVIGSKRLMNSYNYVINSQYEYVIHSGEYTIDDAGNITLLKNKSLNFYNVTNPDGSKGIEIFIKDVYKSNPNSERILVGARSHYSEMVAIDELYIYKGRNITIPFEYKRYDDDKNLIISAAYKQANPNFYKIDANGNMLISPDYYSISEQGIIQPQSAMVVIDYHTGELRAVVGGRNVEGRKIYNRAVNPRQPGSSIKPIGVYTPALDKGVTVATVFDDVPRYNDNGVRWPTNYFDYSAVKYKGIMTVREALHDSNNVVAVKVAEYIGVDKIIPYLEKFGITTLVTEGAVSDVNLSAVALGGMTNGVTPFDITSAYGAIGNGGTRNETITFTKIVDKDGNILIDNTPEQTFVVDEPVAYLMQDMMISGCKVGLGKRAAIRPGNVGIPVAGKTGTTSNKNDAWFVGYTPYYVAGLWIGNDIQVSLTNGSSSSADFWKVLMEEIHEGYADKAFKTHQEIGLVAMNVDNKSGKIPTALSYRDPEGNTIIREYFIPGTQPTEEDDIHVEVTMCSESGKLITPYCPSRTHVTKVLRVRLDPDYDPNAKGYHYAIADDEFTIPRSYIEESVVSSSGTSDSNFCFIHTEVPWTAQAAADKLPDVPMYPFGSDELLIGQSIIIKTIHYSSIKVDAGSRINSKGTIIALDISDPSTLYNVIYPWQIASFELNPDGPQFSLPTTEDETNDAGENGFDIIDTTTESPLDTEESNSQPITINASDLTTEPTTQDDN